MDGEEGVREGEEKGGIISINDTPKGIIIPHPKTFPEEAGMA